MKNSSQPPEEELLLGALWTIIQVIAGHRGADMLEHLLTLKGFSKREIGVIIGEMFIFQAENYPHRSEFRKNNGGESREK